MHQVQHGDVFQKATGAGLTQPGGDSAVTQALPLYRQKLGLAGAWPPSVCGQGAVGMTKKEAQDGGGALLQQHPPAQRGAR